MQVLSPVKCSSIHLISLVRAHINFVLYNADEMPGPSNGAGGGRKHPDLAPQTDNSMVDAGGRIHIGGSKQINKYILNLTNYMYYGQDARIFFNAVSTHSMVA